MNQSNASSWFLGRCRSRRMLWLAGVVAAAAILVYAAGERIWSLLPLAVFLLCPLLHIFSHKNHHGGDGTSGGCHSGLQGHRDHQSHPPDGAGHGGGLA